MQDVEKLSFIAAQILKSAGVVLALGIAFGYFDNHLSENAKGFFSKQNNKQTARMREFRQHNETDALKTVIIGLAEGYRKVDAYLEIHNENLKEGFPDREDLIVEFEDFVKVLKERNIEVLRPDYVGKFVYDQLTPRDIGVTIGNKFVICNMKLSSRRYEVAGIFKHILQMEGSEPNILLPPQYDILLEGGDIIVDKGFIFLGISQRSNQKGLEYLQAEFGHDYHVVPVYCSSLKEGENVLHLDCTFNPVGEDMALIYPDGFKEIPKEIKDNYRWIEVNHEEQSELATNVLSIDKKTIIARDHPVCKRVNGELRKAGFEVIEVKFDGAPSAGGSFRCCSLPLIRA